MVIKEITLVIKSPFTKRTTSSESFIYKFNQTLKEEIIFLHKQYQKIERILYN